MHDATAELRLGGMQRTTPRLAACILAAASASFGLSQLPGQDQTSEVKVNSAVQPVARDARHMARHEKINAEVQAKQGAVDLVFIGDSITQSWETSGKAVWAKHYGERKAVNLGISGDRTEHVLWRLENGNLEGITPRVAVIMIGTNNFGHGKNDAAEILAGVQAIVANLRVRSPKTRVLLLDIFPRGEDFNPMRGGIAQINQAFWRLHDGEFINYLPIGHHFIEDDGSIDKAIMPDFLHLTPAGYTRWARAIEPTLHDLMQRDIVSRTGTDGGPRHVPVPRTASKPTTTKDSAAGNKSK